MSYLGPTSHENLATTTPRRGLVARLRAWWCKQPDSFDTADFGLPGVRWTELRPRLPRRLDVALAVLRGQPVAYRITVKGGIEIPAWARGGRVVECSIDGGGQADYGIVISGGSA